MLLRVSCAEDEKGNLFKIPKFLIWELEKLTGSESPTALSYLVVEELLTAGLNPKAFTPDQGLLWMAQKYKLLGER